MASKNIANGMRRSALTLALGLCFVGAAIAANSGGLRISIKGANGQPVAGATVKLSSPSSLVSKSGVTDANGNVNIVGLDPATNYTIQVQASGYSPFSSSNVAVVSDKNLSVGYVLGRTGGGDATNLDAIVVTGTSLAAVDTTSATVSTVLTLEQVEALPTARSYQSYLQLVPGVKPSSGGNPSSKSGVNYADIGGAVGQSTDNLYYIDGVNVTDPLTGTFGSNLNSEIIQELQVMTGGVPAEFAGGAGLISKVITKSGGNEFHGSINYYLQNSNLVAKNKHLAASEFSTYDAAVTLGGPILKDRIWFFGSFQKKNHEEDVTDPVSQQFMRSVSRESDLAFGKITWQVTDNDRVTATFFNDPTTISGSLSPSVVNSRSNITEQGGDNYKIDYSHDWDSFSIGAYAFRHEGQLSSLSSTSDPFNNVAYHTDRTTKTNADLSLGGSGANTLTNRDNEEIGLNFDWYLSTSWGEHTIRGGLLRNEGSYTEQVAYLGAGAAGARYTSISSAVRGHHPGGLLQQHLRLARHPPSPAVRLGAYRGRNRNDLCPVAGNHAQRYHRQPRRHGQRLSYPAVRKRGPRLYRHQQADRALPPGSVDAGAVVGECRCAFRAQRNGQLGRRQHPQVRLGYCPACLGHLRPRWRRSQQDLGLLRPLLRPGARRYGGLRGRGDRPDLR